MGHFDCGDTDDPISTSMHLHYSSQLPLQGNETILSQDHPISHTNVSGGKLPLGEPVQANEILLGPACPKMTSKVLAKVPSRRRDKGRNEVEGSGRDSRGLPMRK